MSRLIDSYSIDSFIEKKGIFLYTSVAFLEFTKSHLINALHFPSASLRNTRVLGQQCDCKENNGMIPVQLIDTKSLFTLIKNARLSKKYPICVYSEPGEDVLTATLVATTLYFCGFDVYYLNCYFKTLDPKYLTQDFISLKKVDEKLKFNINTISIDKTLKQCKKHCENTKILDVRPKTAYDGTSNFFKVNGHVPCALNLLWKKIFVPAPIETDVNYPSNVYKSKEEIEQLLNDIGIFGNNKIILYCFSSLELTSMLFAMLFILEWKNVYQMDGAFITYQYLNQICPLKYPVIKVQ